jgi:hypothetical protein
MKLVDSIVEARFTSEKASRVVVFPGFRRSRGYLIKSTADELKIKSFLKLLYVGQFSILFLGYLLASEWSRDLIYALGRPSPSILKRIAVVSTIYVFVVGAPYWFLWRTYRKALFSFVSPEDEVVVSGKNAGRLPLLVGASLIALAVLAALGVMFLTRSTVIPR